MKLALIGPGIMPIPPNGWGAVESLIWDYALELDELDHEGTIINTPDWDEIIKYLNEDSYEFAHLHYDVFHPIMDRISEETNIPKLAISSHYPYIDQPHMHRRDGYDRTFDWIINNKKYYVFCISKKDYNTFKNAGADESRLILSENGANHKRFTYRSEALKPNRSLYLGQVYHRKKQWIYQCIDSIDFVGQNTGATAFDPSINSFVSVIPDEKLEDIEYVEEKIKENREVSISMRDDIRQFAIDNFSWESLVKLYAENIEKLKANAG